MVVCVRAANSGSIRESAGTLRPMRRKCCVLVDKGKQTQILNEYRQKYKILTEIQNTNGTTKCKKKYQIKHTKYKPICRKCFVLVNRGKQKVQFVCL